MVVADCLGKPPRGCRQCRRREPHLQGPGKLRVHQFTPAREAFTRQEIPCCREEWDEDLVIVSSVVSTPSIWEERLSTVAYDLLRNSGSQGDRLTRPRSLYCHSLGKAGRRACVSCHQMLIIMTNDEMCYFHQSHGRQKGHRELGCRRLSGFGSRSLCSYPGTLRLGARGSVPIFYVPTSSAYQRCLLPNLCVLCWDSTSAECFPLR